MQLQGHCFENVWSKDVLHPSRVIYRLAWQFLSNCERIGNSVIMINYIKIWYPKPKATPQWPVLKFTKHGLQAWIMQKMVSVWPDLVLSIQSNFHTNVGCCKTYSKKRKNITWHCAVHAEHHKRFKRVIGFNLREVNIVRQWNERRAFWSTQQLDTDQRKCKQILFTICTHPGFHKIAFVHNFHWPKGVREGERELGLKPPLSLIFYKTLLPSQRRLIVFAFFLLVLLST